MARFQILCFIIWEKNLKNILQLVWAKFLKIGLPPYLRAYFSGIFIAGGHRGESCLSANGQLTHIARSPLISEYAKKIKIKIQKVFFSWWTEMLKDREVWRASMSNFNIDVFIHNLDIYLCAESTAEGAWILYIYRIVYLYEFIRFCIQAKILTNLHTYMHILHEANILL